MKNGIKTAMQDLLDDCKKDLKLAKFLEDDKTYIVLEKIINYIEKNLIEKEKDQINVSFISGCIEALSYQTPVRDRIKEGYFEDKAEQYFNYTYNTNTNEKGH
jgi:hypothetical protein